MVYTLFTNLNSYLSSNCFILINLMVAFYAKIVDMAKREAVNSFPEINIK